MPNRGCAILSARIHIYTSCIKRCCVIIEIKPDGDFSTIITNVLDSGI